MTDKIKKETANGKPQIILRRSDADIGTKLHKGNRSVRRVERDREKTRAKCKTHLF